MKKIAKDRKVIPDPIDDRKFQEWKESGKSGILLGITLNPKKSTRSVQKKKKVWEEKESEKAGRTWRKPSQRSKEKCCRDMHIGNEEESHINAGTIKISPVTWKIETL